MLVTGATGFIGGHLVPRLIATGYEVRALARASSRAEALRSAGVDVVHGDVLNARDVDRAVEDCRVVFHLAVARGSRDVILGGTDNVARAAARAGVSRVVFASSTRVYGLTRQRRIDEGTPIKPDSRYGRFKAEAERVLLDHQEGGGAPVVIARLPLVLGLGGHAWQGTIQAVESGRFRLIGAGTNHYHPVDVSDVADGLLLCGTVKGIEGRIYILAGDESRPLRAVIASLEHLLGTRTPRSAIPAIALRAYALLNAMVAACGGPTLPRFDRAQLFLQDFSFDISRARAELGYVPKVSVDETLRRTVSWYREQGRLTVGGPRTAATSAHEG
jgi:farnesol dehydrogenase